MTDYPADDQAEHCRLVAELGLGPITMDYVSENLDALGLPELELIPQKFLEAVFDFTEATVAFYTVGDDPKYDQLTLQQAKDQLEKQIKLLGEGKYKPAQVVDMIRNKVLNTMEIYAPELFSLSRWTGAGR